MSAGHSAPQVLYSVNNIRAFHVQNGEENEITTSGPQQLELLMVPTSSPFADLSNADPTDAAPEEDFYLHLRLPPELDQALPATTQIYHKPPSSYLIPRWDLGPEAGAFIRIEFPSIGRGPNKVSQEEVDTFETILAQCTAFLERAEVPKDLAPYDPSAYAPGEGYISSPLDIKRPRHGQIVLIDEENGSVVGELSEGYALTEAPSVTPGSKRPVEIQLPQAGQGNTIQITNASEEYLVLSRHPAYAKSTVVQTSAKASRLIVAGSDYLVRTMSNKVDNYTKTKEPNPAPMTFSPATHERIRQLHHLTTQAVGLSAKTVGSLGRHAQNIGAKVAGRGEKKPRGVDKDGRPNEDFKPSILNKSMIAFSTIADGIDYAGRALLTSGSAAASNVVGHKYGTEAGDVAARLGGGVKNVGLVYIDAVGVSRKALIKSVAKGMVVGRMPNGQNLVVGTGDGGVVPEEAIRPDLKQRYSSQTPVSAKPGYGIEGYGAHANRPPSYSPSGYPGFGEPAGAGVQGQQYPREKHEYS